VWGGFTLGGRRWWALRLGANRELGVGQGERLGAFARVARLRTAEKYHLLFSTGQFYYYYLGGKHFTHA